MLLCASIGFCVRFPKNLSFYFPVLFSRSRIENQVIPTKFLSHCSKLIEAAITL